MNDIIQRPGGGVPSDPAQMQDYYAKYAEAYSQAERRAGASVSVRNGALSVGDQAIPGNQFAAIILDSVRMNAYYTESFNAQNITPPRCYAIGRSDAEMAPHPDMRRDLEWFQPQAERCGACPHNEFGSGKTGTGKACANRRRLLLLLAGSYAQTPQGFVLQPITDLDHYATSTLLTLTIPPTSIGSWQQFVQAGNQQWGRPPFGVVARVYLYTHPKHGKEAIGFEALAPVPDEWSPTIFMRHQEAVSAIMEGFDPPPAKPQRGGGFYQQQNQHTR